MRPKRRRWPDRLGVALALALAHAPVAGAAPGCSPGIVPDTAAAAMDAVALCRAADRLGDGVPPLRRWLERQPDDHERRVVLAQVLAELNDLAGAEAEYDRVLATPGGDSLPVRKARADVLAWRGRVDEAVAAYRQVLDASPHAADAWLGLGLALGWQDKPGESEDALREALRADPGNAEATKALDTLLASPAYAAWRAERARHESPDDPARWIDSANALAAAERWWDVEPLVAEGTRRWPQDAQLRALATDVERQRRTRLEGELGKARQAVAADPDDRAARLAAATALAGLGDQSGARDEYEAAHERWPEDEAISRELAKLASYEGDTGRALTLYDDLAAAHPDDAALGLERARVLAWDGQLTESAAAYRRAAAADPAAAAHGIADTYRWGGQLGMAAAHYRDAARLDPEGDDGEAAAGFFAEEGGRITATLPWTWLRDSDDFRRWRLGATGATRLGVSTELALEVAHYDYAQHGVDFAAERPRLSLLAAPLPWLQVALAYGPNIYDGDVTQSGAGTATAVLGPETAVSVGYDHYDIVDEVLTAASALADRSDAGTVDPIQGDRVRVAGQTVLPWRLELAANAAWGWYSDGNRLTQLGASLGRRILRTPWLRVGWDVSYLSYAERSTDELGRTRYWDPPDYLSNGFVVRAQQPVTSWARVSADGRVGWGIERGHGSLERAAGVGLDLGPWHGVGLDLGGRWGQTARASGSDSSGYEIWNAYATLRWRWGGS